MKFLRKYGNALTAVVAVAVLYGVMFSFGITCPIKYLFGISCPGCGMTRAFLSAARLDIAKAFYYHPLWIGVVPASVALFLLSKFKKTRAFKAVFALCVVLMIAVYIYRITGDSEVTVFAWREGLVYRLFEKIRDFLR